MGKGYMISTIIFDLDDTLYDEIDYCKSGFRAAAAYIAERFGGADARKLYDSMWLAFASGNRTKAFNAALGAAGVKYDDDCIATLIEVYRNHHPAITLPQESREVLNEFKGKYKLALLTDGFLPAQQLKVRALGIERYFSSIIYTEELGRENWKPSPLGFQKIMFDLGIEAGQCAYVGDNEQKDFIAPNELGMASIKVTRPSALHPDASNKPEARPLHTIFSLCELAGLLKTL
jgi:putative hydrolase of the HAD superfamily